MTRKEARSMKDRRTNAIAVYASQFGVPEAEVVPYLTEQLGPK